MDGEASSTFVSMASRKAQNVAELFFSIRRARTVPLWTVHGRHQAGGAVTDVLELTAPWAAGGGRPVGVTAFLGLDRGVGVGSGRSADLSDGPSP